MVRLPLVLAVLMAACAGGPAASGGSGSPTSSPGPSGSHGATACGAPSSSYAGWPAAAPDLVPILVSSELAVGPNRFLFALTDARNKLIAAPDLPVRVAFYDLAADPARPTQTVDASFLWTIEGELGLYRATVPFPCSGDWGAEIRTAPAGGTPATVRVVFSVRPESATPAIGSAVPASDTPTAADAAGLRAISTDRRPDPDFYRRSVREALAAGQPFVLVFATPAFCASRTCGPALEIVKQVAPAYKDRVTFIHVEPYRLAMVDGALQPEGGRLQVAPIATEWGLPTEPYIFVVGRDGRLAAKFEGVAGADELRAAIEQAAR
ncbi:MAG TPA: hypothetical protein VFK38_09575 [Candidatus Limnocylindrales bacterium]|nr:hypothetical protein [Candidatus Limnocylindrales bacterium]